MRMDHVFARRPGEDGELAVWGCHQRHGVALVVNELRRRKMTRTAELSWLDDPAPVVPIGSVTIAVATCKDPRAAHQILGAEGEHLVAIIDDSSSIDPR